MSQPKIKTLADREAAVTAAYALNELPIKTSKPAPIVIPATLDNLTSGILSDCAAAPVKTVTHAYGDDCAKSTFDAFGRTSREKSAGYDLAVRIHADSRKVGGMLLEGVYRALNGKPNGPAITRMVTADLVALVRTALKGEAATKTAVSEALRSL